MKKERNNVAALERKAERRKKRRNNGMLSHFSPDAIRLARNAFGMTPDFDTPYYSSGYNGYFPNKEGKSDEYLLCMRQWFREQYGFSFFSDTY